MGQLERYGLYVLVVVIFLILGVAIWGGGEAVAVSESVALVEYEQQSTQPLVVPETASDRLSEFFLDEDNLVDEPESSAEPEPAPMVVTPERQPVSQPVVTPAPAPTGATQQTYIVKLGDSWSRISRKFYDSEKYYKELKRANGATSNNLMPGDEIIIPVIEGASQPSAPAAPTAAATGDGTPSASTYIVRSGDSPAKISKQIYGTERHAKAIMEANGITNPRSLQIGQELRMPVVNR